MRKKAIADICDNTIKKLEGVREEECLTKGGAELRADYMALVAIEAFQKIKGMARGKQ